MYLDPVLDITLRCCFLILFGAALAHKVWDFGTFRPTVAAYVRGTMLDRPIVVGSLAVLVALGEGGALVSCAIPLDRALRAAVISAMLMIYAGAMALNLLRGNTLLDCGCHWGSDRQPVRWALVWRNVILGIISLILALPLGERALGYVDAMTIIGALIVAGLVYSVGNLIIALPSRTDGTTT